MQKFRKWKQEQAKRRCANYLRAKPLHDLCCVAPTLAREGLQHEPEKSGQAVACTKETGRHDDQKEPHQAGFPILTCFFKLADHPGELLGNVWLQCWIQVVRHLKK